jgi:hypothetical protein
MQAMKINNFRYLFNEGIRGIFLHGFMSFAAICVTVACLLIVGSFYALTYNVNVMVQEMDTTNEILVFVDRELSDAEARSVSTQLSKIENVYQAIPISREDALMALTGEWTEPTDEMIHHFIKRIKKLQPVTPQLKTGHWEWVQYDSNPNIGNWHCSECGRIVFLLRSQKSDGSPLYDYCPWCGARMAESEDME